MEKKIYAQYIKEGMELKTVWGFMEVTDVEVITWNEVSPYTGRTIKCAKTIVTVNNTKTNMDKFTFPLVEMVYVRIPEVKETKEIEVAEVTVAKVDEVVTIEVPVADAVDTIKADAVEQVRKAFTDEHGETIYPTRGFLREELVDMITAINSHSEGKKLWVHVGASSCKDHNGNLLWKDGYLSVGNYFWEDGKFVDCDTDIQIDISIRKESNGKITVTNFNKEVYHDADFPKEPEETTHNDIQDVIKTFIGEDLTQEVLIDVTTTNAIADAKMEKAKMEQEIGHPFNTEDIHNYIEQHPVFKDKPYYIKAYIDDCLTGDQGNLDHIYSKEVDLDTCKIWVRLADAELDRMYHRGECSPTKSQYKCMGTGKE